MLGLVIKIFPHCSYSHAPNRPRKIASLPHRRRELECDTRLTRKVGLDCLDHIRDDVIRAQTQQTAKVICMRLGLQHVIIMTAADFG